MSVDGVVCLMAFDYMHYSYLRWYNSVQLISLVLFAWFCGANCILIRQLEKLNIVNLERFYVILLYSFSENENWINEYVFFGRYFVLQVY